ncbi:10355_t:CDS:2, partial [Paraglomus occultum]
NGHFENITESNDLKYRSKMTRIPHDVADDDHKLVEYFGEVSGRSHDQDLEQIIYEYIPATETTEKPAKGTKNQHTHGRMAAVDWNVFDVVVEKQKRNMT